MYVRYYVLKEFLFFWNKIGYSIRFDKISLWLITIVDGDENIQNLGCAFKDQVSLYMV